MMSKNFTHFISTPAHPSISNCFNNILYIWHKICLLIFDAFCLDILNDITTPATYNVSGLSTGNLGFPGYTPPLSLSNLQVAQINKLLDIYTASTNKAAMQVALWEVVNETKSGALSVSNNNGTFYITQNTGVRNAANTLLAQLNNLNEDYRSPDYDLLLLTPISGNAFQGLIGWCDKGKCDDPGVPPQEISEPGTLLLLSAGLGMVFFSTRRRLAV